MSKAVMYVRVSSKEQHQDGFSIPAQRKLLEDYARDNGLQVLEAFEDVETAKRAGRQSFERLVAFLRRNPDCKILLVEKTDRLYRNIRDWVTLDELDVEVHFVKENFVLNDGARSSEKFVHGIKVLMAKNYVDNLSEETSKGMLEKARQGLYPSFAPLGYLNCKETKSIIPDPVRAPLVVKLFEAYATGRHSLSSLVKLSWEIGLRTRKGNKVARSAIATMLSKLTYTGDFVWNGTTYSGTYEPILSRALFDEVQNRLSAASHSKPKRHDFAFRGLVRCGNCGCMVTADMKKGKYVYYRCTHNKSNCKEKPVNESDLAAMLGAPLKDLVLTRERVEWILEEMKGHLEEGSQRRSAALRQMNKDRKELETKLDLIYEDKLAGTITPDFWKRKHGEYTARLNWIKTELREMEAAPADDLANAERIIELSQKAYSLYLKRNSHEQRELLDILQSNSTMKDKKVHVQLREPFATIADGAMEDREKIARGESILAQNENWLLG